MSVRIGHASLDENKKTKNGAAGDQTGSEVCIRSWYSKPWGFVLRPKTAALAEASAKACEAGCANNKIGYDQNQRNTLNTQAKKVGYNLAKIVDKCETDCSAFMTVCAIAGGANIAYTSNAPTTSTMKTAFINSGSYDLLTDSKYLTSDKYLKRGDILVKAGSHTVMVLDNGSAATTSIVDVSAYPTLKKGSKGEYVKKLQTQLILKGFSCGKGKIDGDFGNDTLTAVKNFQRNNKDSKGKKLTVDGIVGTKTWEALYR